ERWISDGNQAAGINGTGFDSQLIMSKFEDVKAVNSSLLQSAIPCLIIAVEKNRKGHIRALHEQIALLPEVAGIKMILYVEHTVDPHDLTTALWRFCNNLDPRRDSILTRQEISHEPGKYTACIGLDGTRKTKEWDD